jgi:hypothetical protein
MAVHDETYLDFSVSTQVTDRSNHEGTFRSSADIRSHDEKIDMSLSFSQTFLSEADAAAFGLMRARAWIDHYKEASALRPHRKKSSRTD